MKALTALILLPLVLATATLADTVDAASWRLAQEQYPELRNAKSFLYRVFAAEAARLRRDNPGFFNDPEWSLKLIHSMVPQRVRLRFTVFQAVSDGALLEATIGKYGRYPTEVDWAAPSLLDGHRRSDIVMKDGIRYSDDKITVFVLGLKSYSEKQSGEIDVYPAGDYNYSTILGAAKRVPRFALTASKAVAAVRGTQ